MIREIASWIAVSAVLAFPATAVGFGALGHQIVGAIADERLANSPTGEKIKHLLDGITLETASVIPDEIKGWDKKGVDDPSAFRYTAHPKIDAQLADFWRANQPTHQMDSPNPSHHWFHYTDVPLRPVQKYADGKAGRSKWDVVQMIPYCTDVLTGKIPEQNDRKITKPIAIILLAHFVGDIHQPLHVGAEFFDPQGRSTDPERDKSALGDEGGNTIYIRLRGDPLHGRLPHSKRLHSFWDVDTVNAHLPEVPETMKKEERRALIDPARKALAHTMATEEPRNWKLPASVGLRSYAETWADEIMPFAREAHERLIFRNVRPLQQEDRVVAQGDAEEKATEGVSYKEWASKEIREKIHVAGWRLADLLEKSLATPAATPPPSPTPSP
jgi:hypothetical protein